MAGEGKPPHVDAMKCYMMGPHRVGVAREAYWPHGPSLEWGERRLLLAGADVLPPVEMLEKLRTEGLTLELLSRDLVTQSRRLSEVSILFSKSCANADEVEEEIVEMARSATPQASAMS